MKSNYGNRISRFWTVGFSPSAGSSVLKSMAETMKSNTCDAEFKESLDAKSLEEKFQELA